MGLTILNTLRLKFLSSTPSAVPSEMPSTNPFLDELELFHFRAGDLFLTANTCEDGALIFLHPERNRSVDDPELSWTQVWRISHGQLINACSPGNLSIAVTTEALPTGIRTLEEGSSVVLRLAPENEINGHFKFQFIADGGVSIYYTPSQATGSFLVPEKSEESGNELELELELSGTCAQFQILVVIEHIMGIIVVHSPIHTVLNSKPSHSYGLDFRITYF